MNTNTLKTALFLFAILVNQTGFGQPPSISEVLERFKKNESFSYSENTDPSSLPARLTRIDKSSPSLLWSNIYTTYLKGGETITTSERDVLLKLISASNEERDELNILFARRLELHNTNRKSLKGADIRERKLSFIALGARENYDGKFLPPDLSPNVLKKCVEEYERLERESEISLVESLAETIDPRQFEIVVQRWIRADLLYMPIARKFLALDEEQLEKIRVDCDKAYVTDHKVKEEVAKVAKNGSDSFEIITNRNDWQEARLLPFRWLTPAQFKSVATSVRPNWRESRSFAERIEKIKNLETAAARAERKVIMELYEQGAVQGL